MRESTPPHPSPSSRTASAARLTVARHMGHREYLRRRFASPAPYYALAALLLAAAIASQFRLHVPSRRVEPAETLLALRGRRDLNVVFLLIDTLRADRLGVYGYGRPTSPVIDAAAAYGIVFDDVVSQSSWTKTSMASMWTGTHPIHNGILRYSHVIPEQAAIPAWPFLRSGYPTGRLRQHSWLAAHACDCPSVV